jgi:alkylated DNA repair dioxygenase AlkB
MNNKITQFSHLNILPQNGEVYYIKNFFSNEESDFLFNTLLKNIDWKHEAIKIFGKQILQPRLTAYYGEHNKAYSYSGITMAPIPMNDNILFIKHRLELLTQTHFNAVLLNLYRNGDDSMGWHADNEKELGKNPMIASVSFGETRIIKYKHIFHKHLRAEIELKHGSLLLMKDETQHFWHHSIAKSKKNLQSRINLTFRRIL